MTDITQPIRDALVEIIVADSGREMMQARHEFNKICTPAAMTALLARLAAAEKDAARYWWLRHGDNDEYIIAYADGADKFSRLSRNKELDDAIDAAMKGNL